MKSWAMTICQMVWLVITLLFIVSATFSGEKFPNLGGLGFAYAGLHDVHLGNFCPSARTTREVAESRLNEYFVKPVPVPPPRKVLWDPNMQFANPAFGGRGTGILISRTRKRKRIKSTTKLKFNQTLGYPGEGWKQFSVDTWNTHCLTNERCDY